MPKVSAVVPVYNEEMNIGECLKCLAWVDEIIVVDGGSTDATRALCVKNGIAPIDFPPDQKNHEKQRWHGILAASGDWILCVDADERVPEDLAREIRAKAGSEANVIAYKIPFLHFFFGQPFRYGGNQGQALLRLFKKGSAVYPNGGQVHEQLSPNGAWSVLQNSILHYGTRDLNHYFQKFNVYTTLSAEKLYQRGTRLTLLNGVLNLVIKPLYFFMDRFVFKKGFKDGFWGFVLAWLSAFNVVVSFLKLREIQKNSDTK